MDRALPASFGYTLPESAAAENPTVKITRVRAQPDPSKVREFADDVRDGKFVLPIGRRMPFPEGTVNFPTCLVPSSSSIMVVVSTSGIQEML
jgi:hypothetical protein